MYDLRSSISVQILVLMSARFVVEDVNLMLLGEVDLASRGGRFRERGGRFSNPLGPRLAKSNRAPCDSCRAFGFANGGRQLIPAPIYSI